MISTTWVALALAGLAAAQDFSIPSGWSNPSTSTSEGDLATDAQNLIGTLSIDSSNGGVQGLGYWQSANWLTGIANLDHFKSQTTNQQAVTDALNGAFSSYANYDQYGYNDDALWWGTAAYYGYRAYGDQNLLNNAIATWKNVNNYVITDAVASSGSLSSKSFSIEGSCNGQSMVGGVFWRPTSDDQSVNSVTTGLFATLGAYLGEATGDSSYTTAAAASANWIKNANTNSAGLPLDTINGNNCQVTNWVFTYNTGKYIEALAVLASGDSNTWQSTLENTIVAATKNAPWQGDNGIITEGSSDSTDNDSAGFKSVLIRALHEAWARNSGNGDLTGLVKAYTDVQWNALESLASTQGNGQTWFSTNWPGPGPSALVPWGQLAAIDVLVSATNEN
ncbi:hypothetical protein CONPUDRAFT_145683 [Coniophora puteana RWD-64-598 SS2]|uniref:Endo-1,6-alpha-mannosidase n=1 Tax=Coniophora puteana (strain RWD-64-598) TaxID=741705 RepID=A0A5M3MHP0_CONPW|nr:uncharacterized protein CONPUDRAFT_145683 [Coniophora puteana RWD-64-598 SS2]EIW78460.1 hypothetical protein CONPUDRAFT_145683 [Coniophora puteana RWD-64-598 SS2]